MENNEDLKRLTPKQLCEKVISLENKIEMMNLKKQMTLIGLMKVLEELDTVGFLHGAGSKERGKEALIDVLIDNYGSDYSNQYKEILKKQKLEERNEEELNGEQH